MFKSKESKYKTIFTICYTLLFIIALFINQLKSRLGFLLFYIFNLLMFGIAYYLFRKKILKK